MTPANPTRPNVSPPEAGETSSRLSPERSTAGRVDEAGANAKAALAGTSGPLPVESSPAGRQAVVPRRGVPGPSRRWHWLGEKLIESLIRLCGISSIIFVFGIVFFLLREGAQFLFGGLDLVQFFTSSAWYPTSQSNVRYGILALIVGTGTVTLLAMLIALPFGLGTAIFISEFCGPKLKESLKIIIEMLAAVPSVVWGFIGLSVMNPLIINLFNAPVGLNVLNGGIIVALMSVPIIVSISEDALKAVPDSYREAGVALGANQWQMVFRVLMPAAKNGLLAAVLLGVGRAVGETMAVLMATGHSINMVFVKPEGGFNPGWLFESCRTMTATIAAELGETSVHSDHYQVLFIIGLLLFFITFIVNLVADVIVRGVRGKK